MKEGRKERHALRNDPRVHFGEAREIPGGAPAGHLGVLSSLPSEEPQRLLLGFGENPESGLELGVLPAPPGGSQDPSTQRGPLKDARCPGLASLDRERRRGPHAELNFHAGERGALPSGLIFGLRIVKGRRLKPGHG